MKYQFGDEFNATTDFSAGDSMAVSFDMLSVLITSDRKMKEAVWDIGIGGSIENYPVIEDGIVYFGACDKNVYAVSLEDGREIWRFSTNGPIGTSNVVLSGDVLYFGSQDGCLYAVDKEDGRLLWRFQTQDKIYATPAVKSGIVYIGSFDQNMYAVSAHSGKLVWKFALDSLAWNLTVSGDTILVSCYSGNLYAISIEGRLLWKFRSRSGYMFAPAGVRDDVVYQSCNDDNFYAISLKTGKEIWRFSGPDSFDGEPSFHENLVFTMCRDSNFYAIDRNTGRLAWKFKTNNNMDAWRSLVADGILYFGAWDNHLYAVDAKTGSIVWKFKAQAPVDNRPEISEGRIVFGSFDCNLYCVDMQGKLLWKFPTSMSAPSQITMVPPEDQEISVQTIWKEEEKEEEEKEVRVDISDYGEGIKSDYTSNMSKDYIKGKKGYI